MFTAARRHARNLVLESITMLYISIMPKRRGKRAGKRKRSGKHSKARSATLVLVRPERSWVQLQVVLRGLLARLSVRTVLPGPHALVCVLVPVMQQAVLGILRYPVASLARRLSGVPRQTLDAPGKANVKPPGQGHLCVERWEVGFTLP